MKKITVLFQGDSVTDCSRNNCGSTLFKSIGLGHGYPVMVAARLTCDRPDIEWNFINRGISGNRIVDLYARWKADCINLAPDILSILVGVNDTWHEVELRNGVEVPRYARFYRELLEWTREALPQVKFILMDPFVCPDVNGRDVFVPELIERRKVVAEMAKEFDAIHIPLQDIFDQAFQRAPQAHWAADGVHPSPAGHQLIADAWIAAAKKLF